ncbi:hypothetical protein SAMN05421665_0102 [Yoonia rosea]|uniref:Uncharacterized protein n=2 Tax=Yoonia rosea TaxID=287098 RepID=A0A1R3WAC7_9RHOB|nr:hypothetical protein SAMN05421665_0102 [Yoonia rosea]
MAALVWLLWPENLSVLSDPEPWFAFATACVFWIFTEFKTVEKSKATENDVRVARELLELHAGQFRFLLKETDLWQFISSEYYTNLGNFCDRWDREVLFFHDQQLNQQLEKLVKELSELHNKIAMNTVPVLLGGEFKTGFKQTRYVSEDEYDKLRAKSKEANSLASTAWQTLDEIVSKVRRTIPEATVKPL